MRFDRLRNHRRFGNSDFVLCLDAELVFDLIRDSDHLVASVRNRIHVTGDPSNTLLFSLFNEVSSNGFSSIDFWLAPRELNKVLSALCDLWLRRSTRW